MSCSITERRFHGERNCPPSMTGQLTTSSKGDSMATKKRTISVRINDEAKQQVERAVKLFRQSLGASLEKAGEERARAVSLEWAANRYRRGEATLSELAAEAGAGSRGGHGGHRERG